MVKILVPVDGSDNALRALKYAVEMRNLYRDAVELHVINVQRRIASGAVRMFISQDVLDDYHREEGDKALASARQFLASASVPFECHIALGEEAECIARYAKEHACHIIVMGTRGMARLGNLLLGSVASRVLHLSEVPVTLIK